MEGLKENLNLRGLENNYEDNVTWRIGDRKLIRFWEDKWIDKEALCVKFPRLFSISTENRLFVPNKSLEQ